MTDTRLDTVAEAIWRADPSAVDSERWGWLGEGLRNDYRHMAQAAIDALQLTEERGVQFRHAAQVLSLNEDQQYSDYGPAWHQLTRLVSPWVRSDA